MSKATNKKNIYIFIAINLIVFIYILTAHMLTPYMSDDLFYIQVLRDDYPGLKGVWQHNLSEYVTNNCRFIDLLLYKLLLFVGLSLDGSKVIGNIVESISFIALGLLIYDNIPKKKKCDVCVIILIYTMMFSFLAMFGQTVLWACGAAIYLFGITEIMIFVTVFRHLLNKDSVRRPALAALGMLILGLIAGMANENTSGGAFLLLIIFTLNKLIAFKDNNISLKNVFKPYLIASYVGLLAGMALLVSGPGVKSRLTTRPADHFTGFAGLLARVYKISVAMKDLFAPLIIVVVITIVILCVQHYFKSFKQILNDTGCIFLFVSIAVCYVMALINTNENRVYFGGSVFLIIASISLIMNVRYDEDIMKILKYSLASVLTLIVLYNCCINLINLFRINREENERIAWINEAVHNGEESVIVPNYRPQFETNYSAAYENDLTDDPGYWINTFYEAYYGIDEIIAIPRDEFNEMFGLEDN